MGSKRHGGYAALPERLLRDASCYALRRGGLSKVRSVTRRGFIVTVAGGVALPLLAACTPPAPPASTAPSAGGGAGTAAKAGSAYPSFIAQSGGPKPDFPAAGPQYQDGFINYPKNQVKAL